MNSPSFPSSKSASIGIGRLFLIGLGAGFFATVIKTVCELISAPRAPGVPSPLANAIDAVAMGITGHPVDEPTKKILEPIVHFVFGMATGGVYAVLVREFTLVRAGYGALFGICFWLGAHEIGLPLMNLSPTPARMTLWEQGNEFVSHIFFGFALEFARRFLGRKAA